MQLRADVFLLEDNMSLDVLYSSYAKGVGFSKYYFVLLALVFLFFLKKCIQGELN